MFGKQNSNQNTSNPSSTSGVDPRNLRTFISPPIDDVPKKSSVDISLPSARASQEVMQRDFVQSKEEETNKQPEVPETSPFFTVEKEASSGTSQNSSDITTGIRVGFDGAPAVSGEQNPEESASVVEIPKDATAQRSSFQPISSTRTVSESALSGKLSVGNYTGRDGSGVVRAKEIKKEAMKGSVFTILFVLLIIVLVGLIAWGGYSYWKSRSVVLPNEEMPVIVADPVTPPTDVPAVPTFPYNWKMANAVIVDEAGGKTPITELKNAVRELSTHQGDGVLEFYFVDDAKNLTEISSKDLVNKLGVAFTDRSKNMLKESGEGKVYLSKKGSDVRVVLALEVTDRDGALAGFLASEEGIVASIAPLYLGGIDTTGVKARFTDYAHNGYAIRYFNVDIAKNYSLDYGFRRDTVFFATSKDSIRQVWDTLDGKDRPSGTEKEQ